MADTMRIPQIKDVENALRIYYDRLELSNKDIKELFPDVKSNATITRLKHIARDLMVKESILSLNPMYVNTRAAFRAWGIDPEDLEARLTKLRRMKLTADRQVESNA